MNDILASLLPCSACGHAVAHHDGSGCGESRCSCEYTRESSLAQQITIAINEHRSSF